MPHSNFSEVLQISDEGRSVRVDGPVAYGDDDDDLILLEVSAYVTQPPAQLHAGPALGITCTGRFQIAGDPDRIAETATWWFESTARGGAFTEGWAFANAQMLHQATNGGLETYTWSQWVWLRNR